MTHLQHKSDRKSDDKSHRTSTPGNNNDDDNNMLTNILNLVPIVSECTKKFFSAVENYKE